MGKMKELDTDRRLAMEALLDEIRDHLHDGGHPAQLVVACADLHYYAEEYFSLHEWGF